MSRKIIIEVEQRVAADTPEALINVIKLFPQESLTVKLNNLDSTQETRDKDRNSDLEDKTLEEVSDALNIQDTEVKQGEIQAETPEYAANQTRTWLKKLSAEGIRVAITTIIKEGIAATFGQN